MCYVRSAQSLIFTLKLKEMSIINGRAISRVSKISGSPNAHIGRAHEARSSIHFKTSPTPGTVMSRSRRANKTSLVGTKRSTVRSAADSG
ncbi:hypothetical protein EVAR_86839_1 [Eumeta japonica]|uniref:Uncharacterized protein n=1 Tax=Eumeta variegata TaxID=151549 RepID=A0A4C1VUL6_EUMVA|nr:hypothetical protein EVAR_86839_1 [Eumeta japonica]